MTGKLGNMVGQSNSLVSSKDKQVWRVYNGNVKNPKTIRQAAQRSLFVAAKNFQQAFADILDHSWQGVEYGTKSLNHFRSMVLANSGADFPGFFYQPKGAQNFIPQPWPISRGSINLNTACEFGSVNAFNVMGLYRLPDGIEPQTAGEEWQAVLDYNPILQDGDMITVVAFAKKTENSPFIPVYDRFIIDTTDPNTDIEGIKKSQNRYFEMYIGFDEPGAKISIGSDLYLVSAGVIISRQNGNSWLRSKSNMYINTEFNINETYGADAYITACLDSFMNSAAAAESDWYLNQTGDNEDSTVQPDPDPTPVALSVENREAALAPDGTVNAAYVLNGSNSGYLYYDGKYFHLSGTELTATSFAANKSFAASVIRLPLTETLRAQIEAAGYSFIFPYTPDEP